MIIHFKNNFALNYGLDSIPLYIILKTFVNE